VTRRLQAIAAAGLCLALAACGGSERSTSGEAGITRLVFKHWKVPGGEESMRRLVDRFQRENPGLSVVDEYLPASSDQQHQFYATHLGAGSSDFDVFALDVIWTPEFARAGWLLPLDGLFDAETLADFLAGPLAANTVEGTLYAAPWYVDGGVLFYRKDLLAKHGLDPPQTLEQLVSSTRAVLAAESDPALHGFLWQGRQYEGLVCTALEFIHGNGGRVLADGRAALNEPAAVAAMAAMRELIESGVTPGLVTTADEEVTRNIFGSGRALYMRNWPYAWTLFQRDGSPVKDRVGVAPMPRLGGERAASTLGGWQLGVNRNSRHPEEAKRFIEFLMRPEIQEELAIAGGFKPSRRSVYERPRLVEAQPFIAELRRILERTVPRPVTPYYARITQVLQTEFSAVVSGIRPAEDAMARADGEVQRILEATGG
jgi:multiple sugar transport system substrate-binding protein